jgi:hypothetical protein
MKRIVVVTLLALVAVAGCTVQSPTADETPVGQGSQPLLGICAPLTCCFPSGGDWVSDPFEDHLRALGCSTPQAYTESYGRSDWWLYSACPLSVDLTSLILQYSLVGPYYARVVVNECLELHALGAGDPTSAFVEWDPTCPSCFWPRAR